MRSKDAKKQPILIRITSIVVLILLIGWGLKECGSTSITSTQFPAKVGRIIEGGEEKQAQRQTLIQKLIARGVFTKVDRPGSTLRIYTGKLWDTLTVDGKRDFVSVAYAYEYAGKEVQISDIITVYDGFTGKKIAVMGGDGELVF